MNNSNTEQQTAESSRSRKIKEFAMKHQLTALLTITILIAIICSSIGLMLYNTSGTAQIDLSRPDYVGITKSASDKGDTIEYIDYPASGPINNDSLREFNTLYKVQMNNITSDAFGGDPLALDSLKINDVVAESEDQ
jgi:hypothetical protein